MVQIKSEFYKLKKYANMVKKFSTKNPKKLIVDTLPYINIH